MRLTLRALGASLSGLLAIGLVIAACTDAEGPFLPRPPAIPTLPALSELRCVARIGDRDVRCATPGQAGAGGARSTLIVGGQNLYVTLTGSGITTEAVLPSDLDFSFDVTVTNLTRQPFGTQDSATVTPDANGVRVFFSQAPVALGPDQGPITIQNASGSGTFTAAGQDYFQYDSVSPAATVPLFRSQTTLGKRWIFRMPDIVDSLAFTVYVASEVPFPAGFTDAVVDSMPATPFRADTVVLDPTDSVQVIGTARDYLGRVQAAAITYASSNPSAATVSATGMVKGVAAGNTMVTATSPGRPAYRRTFFIVNSPSNLITDSASALENVTRAVAAPGVLANDTDAEGLTAIAETVTTAEGGTATINADGSFTYLTAPGVAARDSFRYHATDGVFTDSAWVKMRVENSNIWYVKGGASGTMDGRDVYPFATIAAAQAVAAATDSILVQAGGSDLDEGVVMEAGQTLIGAGILAPITATLADGHVATELAIGTAPVISRSSAGTAVALSTNNTVRGLGITAASGIGIQGNGFGTFTASRLAVNPAGPALHLVTGTVAADFEILSSASSATDGLVLVAVGGTLTAQHGLIKDPTGYAVDIDGGTADVTLGDSIQANGGTGIRVRNRTAGTVSFNAAEKTLSTGASPAVSLTANTGSTVSFGGGGLAITTTTGAGFSASGGGTVQVTGAQNTVLTTTGNGVVLSGVSTGLSGITLRSVTTGAAVSGISLSSVTGAGLQVTGDGSTAGSGGTLGNTTSSGVLLGSVTADSVRLAFMNINRSAGAAAAITGATFGTLRLGAVVISATGSPALSLNTGTLNGTATLGSTTSASTGSTLTSVGGSFTAGGTILNPTGAGLLVSGGAIDLTFQGAITQGNNAALLQVDGGHTGAMVFNTGALSATNGTGLQFDNADGSYTFSGTTTLNGGNAGIDVLNGSGGTFAFGASTAITNPTGNAIVVSAGSPTFTYSGALTQTNAASAIVVSSNTGGTISFDGSAVAKTFTTTTAPAVSLSSNTGATIGFSGGGLAITTTSGAGLTATGGGTLTVTGANNNITSGTGTALNVQNTTIGVAGLSFVSISAAGGANGIVLNNTGANGLQVTGGATFGSGGTITNTAGADGAIAGNGVYLNNANNVRLSWMDLSGHANHAIYGNTVSGVKLSRLHITGSNGTSAASDEGAISFDNLTGVDSITASNIAGGFEDNIRVVNNTGTLSSLVIANDSVGHNGTTGNDAILVVADASAVVNVAVRNSRFTGARANVVAVAYNNSSSGVAVVANNTITNNHANKLGSDFGIYVLHDSDGAVTDSVIGNSVRDAGGSGIEVDRLAGGTGTMTSVVRNNTVGAAGVGNSGSSAGSAIFIGLVGAGATATHNVVVDSNTVRQFTNYGLRVANRGTTLNYLNATVRGNNIAEPSPNAVSGAFPTSGMRFELGTASGHDGLSCLNIVGNTVTSTSTASSHEIRVFGRFSTKTGLPGFAGNANTLIAGQNTITVAGGGLGDVNATSTNPFQAVCPPI